MKACFFFNTGTGNKRRFLNISKLSNILSENFWQALIGFHNFTGCDTTSSFAGKGKICPLSLLQKDDDLVQIFKHLGQYDILEESVYSHLEKFGCLIMIGYPTSNEVDTVRCDIVKNRFTPWDDRPLAYCNFHHVVQVSEDTSKEHLSGGQPQKIEIPDPDHYSWKRTDYGNLLIDWCAQDILPLELVDIISLIGWESVTSPSSLLSKVQRYQETTKSNLSVR